MKKLFLLFVLSFVFVNSSFAWGWDTNAIVKDYERTRACVNETEAFYKFWQDHKKIVVQCGTYRTSSRIYFLMEDCIKQRPLKKTIFEFDSTTNRKCAAQIKGGL